MVLDLSDVFLPGGINNDLLNGCNCGYDVRYFSTLITVVQLTYCFAAC